MNERILAQATDWLLTLQRQDVSAENLAAWQRWLSQDPAHKLAFDRLQSVQECIDAVAPVPWPTESEIEADGYSGDVAVSDWPRDAAQPSRPRRRGFMAGAVAGLAAALIGSIGYHFLGQSGRVETGVGELRRLQLEDGSSITLGGRTRVTVDYDSARRDVMLESGEAFFEIAKDARRPFVVHSAGSSIKAIGTAFNVRRSDSGVTVAVAEGVVEVAQAQAERPKAPRNAAASSLTRLEAGQRMRIEPQRAAAPSPVAPQAVAAWREGERQYLAEPLADVVADLGRYSTRRIVIEDPAIGRLLVTGAVFEREMDRWLMSLQSALPVKVVAAPDGSVLILASTR